MDGIQYINNPQGDKCYAVVDLNIWSELFNSFLEEAEDTLVYDKAIGKSLDKEKLLNVLKQKLQSSDLKFSNDAKNQPFQIANNDAHLEFQENGHL